MRSRLLSAKYLGLLALSFVTLSGTSCPVPSVGLTCSNNLDGSQFGFLLTVPADFVCTTVVPNSQLLVNVRYRQNGTGNIASVIVSPTTDSGTPAGDGVVVTDQGNYTNANNVTFTRTKISIASLNAYSYVATVTLASGNTLGITIAGFSDDPALLTILNAFLDAVQLT